MRLLPLLALALVATPALAQDDGDTDFIILKPDQIGQIFCISRVGNDQAPIMGLLTPELTQAITDANAKDDAYAAANPDEEPPLGDGIPWQATTDYAARCTIGTPTVTKTEASMPVTYDFPEDPTYDYTDTLKLKLAYDNAIGAKVWRIDDVVYGDGSDLKAELVSAFSGN